jgi:Ni/Co efflux regulator RcnB
MSNGEIEMRMLFSTLAVAVVVATPALSQTSQGNQRTNDSYSYQREENSRTRANENNRVREQRSTNAQNDVYSLRGLYVGTDPDPVIRDQLGRDPSQGD